MSVDYGRHAEEDHAPARGAAGRALSTPAVGSMEPLDELLDIVNAYAETNIAIVKKASVACRLPLMN